MKFSKSRSIGLAICLAAVSLAGTSHAWSITNKLVKRVMVRNDTSGYVVEFILEGSGNGHAMCPDAPSGWEHRIIVDGTNAVRVNALLKSLLAFKLAGQKVAVQAVTVGSGSSARCHLNYIRTD